MVKYQFNLQLEGNGYFRLTLSRKKDPNEKLIRKKFYAETEKDVKALKDDYLSKIRLDMV